MFEVGFISTTSMIGPLSNKKIIYTLFCYQACFQLASTGENILQKNSPAWSVRQDGLGEPTQGPCSLCSPCKYVVGGNALVNRLNKIFFSSLDEFLLLIVI